SYAFAADHPVENGAWHQVAATWDGTALTAYLDGHSLGTQTAPVMATTATNFAIGLEGDNGCCGLSNATVDDTAVYPAALTAAQILNHFTLSGNSQPTAPTNVSATSGPNQAAISWSPASGSPGAPVTSYRVAASSGNATLVSGTATSVTLTGLPGGAPLTIAVTALNNFGSGYPSSTASATPTGSAATYASAVIGNSTAAFFRLDDGVGSAADSSGNGRDAF